MDTGVVEANSAISLVSNSNFSGDKNVIINGEIFNIGETVAEEFVGFNCMYFYTQDGAAKTLVAVRPDTKVEYSLLNSNDVEFTKIDDSMISYFTGDSKKETEVKLGKNTTILYNGRLLETTLTDAIGTDEFQGELLIIDNDHNGIYDVILVDHAITLIYGGSGLNEATKTYSVYDKLRDKHFDIPDFDKVYLLNGDKPTSWKSIPVGAVMDYYVSKNAKAKVKKEFNWDKIAKDTYFTYEKAICQTMAEKQAREIAQENAKKTEKAKNSEKEITRLLDFKKKHAYA